MKKVANSVFTVLVFLMGRKFIYTADLGQAATNPRE
jgi:hypothetical protein